MESSVFFKSQMSEKDYLYDFNTKQLTIVDPIVVFRSVEQPKTIRNIQT